MRTVFNLSTEQELSFDNDTAPRYALAYAHYQDLHLSSWFFDQIHNRRKEWLEILTFRIGRKTISLGDWCTLKD